MMHKTKAALQSCQCHYQKLKKNKNTRVNACGQNHFSIDIRGALSADRLWGGQPLNLYSSVFFQLTLNEFEVFFQPTFPFEDFAVDSEIEWVMRFRLGESDKNYISVIVCFNETIILREVMPYLINGFLNFLDVRYGFIINYGHYVASFGAILVCLRWRRLISPLAAVTRKPAVLSPSCFKLSISSITSWGIRTVVICDFAFFAPVAITETPCVRCISVYAKKTKEKGLKCISLWASLNIKGEIHLVSAKPGSARNTNRASNHKPLVEVTVMADQQHTQTRPKYQYLFTALERDNMAGESVLVSVAAETLYEAKAKLKAQYTAIFYRNRQPVDADSKKFTWRFLSISERSPVAKPLVIYVNASSEQEARDTMPGVSLILDSRLPYHAFQVMEVRHE
ncbi:host cell division inhibitor Icd-like protein [Klebsiella sp. B345]|uniref:host cell division inhibitor Icd-like protein n=1 Tax=Klebsiella sp. B345 TaxID=2755398 RepID=UPI003DAA3CE1